jgi:hypothetical protein
MYIIYQGENGENLKDPTPLLRKLHAFESLVRNPHPRSPRTLDPNTHSHLRMRSRRS